MAKATVTSKGQITIPVKVRRALGLATDDQVEFVEFEAGQFAIIPATVSVQSLKGMIRKPRKPVTIADMNSAILARATALSRKK